MHNGGTASGTVVNSDGWQIIKEGGLADFTTVNQKGKLQVNAGGTATNVTLKQGGALVTSTAATVTGSNRLGNFSVENGMADNVVLENGGCLDVLSGHTATNTHVDEGVPWMSAVVAQPPPSPCVQEVCFSLTREPVSAVTMMMVACSASVMAELQGLLWGPGVYSLCRKVTAPGIPR